MGLVFPPQEYDMMADRRNGKNPWAPLIRLSAEINPPAHNRFSLVGQQDCEHLLTRSDMPHSADPIPRQESAYPSQEHLSPNPKIAGLAGIVDIEWGPYQMFLREEEKEDGDFPIVPAHAIRATNSQILDPERLSRQSPARRSSLLFPQE